MSQVIERHELWCVQFGSDKVYHVEILLEPDGMYTVDTHYGRRGGSLNRAPKTTSPVHQEKATQIVDKLVKAKCAKGYKVTSSFSNLPGRGNLAPSSTPVAPKVPFNSTSRLPAQPSAGAAHPQLLNAVDDAEVPALLADDDWLLQEKYDGERCLVRHVPGFAPVGYNRRGVERVLPATVCNAIEHVPVACLIDGELIGDTLHAFDLLESRRDIRNEPYSSRAMKLGALLSHIPNAFEEHIVQAVSASGANKKGVMLDTLKRARAEGAVFRRADAPYTEHRPASGGDVRKYKFVATCTAIVLEREGTKRSVKLGLLDAAGLVISVGKVTIPPNHEFPANSCLVEIQYLYAFPNGGKLFQPVYLRQRDDIDRSECTMTQLKFKAGIPHDKAA